MKKKLDNEHIPLNTNQIIGKLSSMDIVKAIIGDQSNDWSISYLTEGNLNQVNVVRSSKGSICVKQSMPYLRILGSEAKMPLNRIVYEHSALIKHKNYAREYVPEVYYFDPSEYLLIFEYYDGFRNLRELLCSREYCNFLSKQIGIYIANTIFLSSDLSLKPHVRRLEAAYMAGNWGMFKWMEELSYTDPYINNPRNRWNSPYLDKTVEEFRNDSILKFNVSILKEKYMTNHETLVHGDLHTDSILIGEENLGIIDYEHSFYGPYGYDFGHYYGHLFLNYFSQKNYKENLNNSYYEEWILKVIEETWNYFVIKFSELWENSRTGGAYSIKLLDNQQNNIGSDLSKKLLIQRTLKNAVGFTGIEIIRRIITVGHVYDLERIPDAYDKFKSELKCLKFGKYLVLNNQKIENISEIISKAEDIYENDDYNSL